MKNTIIIPSVIVFLLILFSCNESNTYLLKGELSEEYNGKTVYLSDKKKEGIILDSTIVKNNYFAFKGKVPDSTTIGYIRFDDKYTPSLFVVEKGNIQMKIDTVSSPGAYFCGTKLNDAYYFYKRGLDSLINNSQLFHEQFQQEIKNLSIEEYNMLEKKEDLMMSELQNYVCSFIKTNKDNVLGKIALFEDTYFFNEGKDLLEIIESFDYEFKQNEKTWRLKQRMTAVQNTAKKQKFTDIKGYDLNGNKVSLSAIAGKGKPVLIDFWASWCGPCRRSMPEIKALYEEFKDNGFIIIGISLDNDKDKWEKATKEDNIPWIQLSNLKRWEEPAAKAYGVNFIPYTILLDKEGYIIAKNLSHDRLKFKLTSLLKNHQIPHNKVGYTPPSPR